LEPVSASTADWTGRVTSAAFLGDTFDYVVLLGNSRIHVPGPKYDPIPEGAHARVVVRDGAYVFWPEEKAVTALAGNASTPAAEVSPPRGELAQPTHATMSGFAGERATNVDGREP
jgi:hypothetical protein